MYRKWLAVAGTIFVICGLAVIAFGENESNTTVEPGEAANFQQRLDALEPDEPITIKEDYIREMENQFYEENDLHSIEDLISKGLKIPFKITSQDDTWVRPTYFENWHSTYMAGKYSDISLLVGYAQRNLFIYNGGLSQKAGLLNILGVAEDWEKPVGTSSFLPWEAFELWLVNYKVKEVIYLDKEWLVVVESQLQGYQTVKIAYEDAKMDVDETAEGQLMLFRVVTPDGYEFERTAGFLP